jgi:CheY-like chemotaxis protein
VEGRGSTFRVRLPCAPAGEPQEIATASPTPDLTRARTRVLAIDDEPQLTFVLERLLASDHEVVVVNSGQAALELLTSNAPPPDVILCDLMMPAMTGIELYEAIAKQRTELTPRFVFMTGGTFTPEGAAFLARVGLPVIEKPFALDTLRAAIAKARGDKLLDGKL